MISVASPRNVDRAELAREMTSISAANQPTETFRHCPKCGAGHFTQRALRGKLLG
jgi:hypothetical protein